MEPSFKLSKRGRIWWASTVLPTGNEKEWTTGCYEKADAEKKAAKWCEMVHRSSRNGMKGGKMHGKHRAQRKAAVTRAVEDVEAAPPAAAEDPQGPAAVPESSPRAAAGPEGTPIGAERAAEIAAKLRSLGDAPDPGYEKGPSSSPEGEQDPEYFEPGASPAAEGQEPGENEAGDLVADLIALGVVAGTVKGITVRLRKKKPPMRPGEANERMLEWFHFGLRHNLRKMIGTAGTLGPTGKMFVGCAGVIGTMLWGAEYIDPPKEEAQQPNSSTAPPTNGYHREPPPPPAPPQASTASTEITAIGRFV